MFHNLQILRHRYCKTYALTSLVIDRNTKNYNKDSILFHLKISYIISLETHIFECKKILLKSWEKEYLQIESDGIQVNTAGKRSSMTSTFILHRVSETSVTLRSFQSGRILTAASSGYRLQEDSNTVQNVSHFKIINEMDGKISLQTNDNKFMSSGSNGQVIGRDTLSEHGKWSFECFRGIRLVYNIAMLLFININ